MSTKNKLKVAVIGATGFTGLDLINLLAKTHKGKNLILVCNQKSWEKYKYF